MKKLLSLLLVLLLLTGCAAQPPVEDVPKEPDAASSAGNTASFPENGILPTEISSQSKEDYIASDWQQVVAAGKKELTALQRIENAVGQLDPDIQAAQGRWYEAMRQTSGINLYGHGEALDHLLRCLGWQGFEKNTAEDNTVFFTNGNLDILADSFEDPDTLLIYRFHIYPSGTRDPAKRTIARVFATGEIFSDDIKSMQKLQRYGVSVGKSSDIPVLYLDTFVLLEDGATYGKPLQCIGTTVRSTISTGWFLVRMAHLYEPSLIADEAQRTDFNDIYDYCCSFADHSVAPLQTPPFNAILSFGEDGSTKEPGFGRTARQLALWQDAENPDHLWIGYQDMARPADAPWEILGWETGGRWLEKQVELSQWWSFFQFNLSADCTDVDCICRDTSARWSAAAAPAGGNVQCSRSGKKDNTDRLAQKLLFLFQNADSQTVAPAQDPALLAADGLSYLERDEGRYGLVFLDEPSALDMVYLQTDPTVAAQHDFPTQLLAWVDPAQPDDLLIATPAADGWQTVCYPGWGAWLCFDLAVGAIGLP